MSTGEAQPKILSNLLVWPINVFGGNNAPHCFIAGRLS
jgi:hypothetical protein